MTLVRKIKWVLLFSLLITGCYYDNEEDLYGVAVCVPTVDPAFSIHVLPVLDGRCNNCHSGISPSGGIKLDTYTEVVKYVSNGKLMGSIKQGSGYSAMPKNSGKLSTCQIQVIQDWIDAGTPDN